MGCKGRNFSLRYLYSLRRTLFIVVVIAFCILPVLWTLLASFEVMPDDVSIKPSWTLHPSFEPYLEIGIEEPRFVSELLTSASLAALTTILTLSIAFVAAYGIARSHFKGRNLIVQGILILACLPVITYLIPLRKILIVLQLYDTFGGTVLAETALYSSLASFVLYGYLNRTSTEPEESARIDGATTLQILLRIVLPISAPGVASTAIIVFVLSWNQVLMPLILTTPVSTIPVAMIDFFMFERELEWPVAAAALISSLMPILIFVAFAHRLLERFSLYVSEDSE